MEGAHEGSPPHCWPAPTWLSAPASWGGVSGRARGGAGEHARGRGPLHTPPKPGRSGCRSSTWLAVGTCGKSQGRPLLGGDGTHKAEGQATRLLGGEPRCWASLPQDQERGKAPAVLPWGSGLQSQALEEGPW